MALNLSPLKEITKSTSSTQRTRYWIAVASKDHVMKGVKGDFAQTCHGKSSPLLKMKPHDWIIYYSPTITFQGKDKCQKFTAIGKIKDDDKKVYQVETTSDFCPYRISVSFEASPKEVNIKPLLPKLAFIGGETTRWGMKVRRGHFEINQHDFKVIAKKMGVIVDDNDEK